MSRVKGSPKTGGRKKGTPNKVAGTLKEFLSTLIDKNRKQIESDLQKLPPKDRLQIIEKFMQYVVPKQKELELSGTLKEVNEVNNEIDYSYIPDDVLFEIADIIQQAQFEKLQKEKGEL